MPDYNYHIEGSEYLSLEQRTQWCIYEYRHTTMSAVLRKTCHYNGGHSGVGNVGV